MPLFYNRWHATQQLKLDFPEKADFISNEYLYQLISLKMICVSTKTFTQLITNILNEICAKGAQENPLSANLLQNGVRLDSCFHVTKHWNLEWNLVPHRLHEIALLFHCFENSNIVEDFVNIAEKEPYNYMKTNKHRWNEPISIVDFKFDLKLFKMQKK